MTLTGSDLARAMLARGDRCVMCLDNETQTIEVINGIDYRGVFTNARNWFSRNVTPINNQGEPLTAAEAGF